MTAGTGESVYENARLHVQSQHGEFNFGKEDLVLEGLEKVDIVIAAMQLQKLLHKVGIEATDEVDADSWQMVRDYARSEREVVEGDKGSHGAGLTEGPDEAAVEDLVTRQEEQVSVDVETRGVTAHVSAELARSSSQATSGTGGSVLVVSLRLTRL